MSNGWRMSVISRCNAEREALVAYLVDNFGQELLVGERANLFGHVRVVGAFELAFEIRKVPLRPKDFFLSTADSCMSSTTCGFSGGAHLPSPATRVR